MDDFDTEKAHFFLDPNLKIIFVIKPEDGQQQAGDYLFYLDVLSEQEAQETCDYLQKAVDATLQMLDKKRIKLELKDIDKNGRNN